jgi:hypothetical protein
MKGRFVVLLNGILTHYSNSDDIPMEFDSMISFEPEYPEGPHTDEEHDEMEGMNDLLQELMKRETRGNNNR